MANTCDMTNESTDNQFDDGVDAFSRASEMSRKLRKRATVGFIVALSVCLVVAICMVAGFLTFLFWDGPPLSHNDPSDCKFDWDKHGWKNC